MSAVNTATTANFRQDAKVIGLVGLAHGVSHFFQLILAPLFPWLKVAFSLSYAELGLLMTGFFFVSGFGQAFAGFVVDKIGPRAVLCAGMMCLAVAALLLSSAHSYPVLLASSMLAGLGNCVFHPSDYTLLNKRVSVARLGHAFSVHGISGNLGWAAAPVFLTTIATAFSWRTALLAAALLPLSVLILFALSRKTLGGGGEAAAALLASSSLSSNEKKSDASSSVGDDSAVNFIRLPAVWMCFAFFCITAMSVGGVQSFATASLQGLYGMSLAWATAGYTAYMLASACGMVWGGFLAAKSTRPDRTITCAFVTSGILALIVATGVLSPVMAIVFMAGIGFGAGVAGPSRDLLVRVAAPKNATGRVYGVVYSGLDLGLVGAPLFFGTLMDHHHPSWVFVGIGVFQILAIATAVKAGSKSAQKSIEVQAAA